MLYVIIFIMIFWYCLKKKKASKNAFNIYLNKKLLKKRKIIKTILKIIRYLFLISLVLFGLSIFLLNFNIKIPFNFGYLSIMGLLVTFLIYFLMRTLIKDNYTQRKKQILYIKKIYNLNSMIIDIIKKHIKVLERKKQTLLTYDDYGYKEEYKIENEIRYFFNKVLFHEIQKNYFYITFVKYIEKMTEIKRRDTSGKVFIPPYELLTFDAIFEKKLNNFVGMHKKPNDSINNINDFSNCRTRLKIKEAIDINYTSIYNTMEDYIFYLFNRDLDIIFNFCNKLERELPEIKNGFDFELYCGEVLKRAGYNSRVTKASGDQGIDVLVEKDDITIAIQCKYYSSPVGNKAVQEAIAGKDFYNASYCAVVSNTNFTPSARQLATKCNVFLINYLELEDKIKEIFEL